ncbi:hypothetical protein RclHR1_00680026 [Rhizophagus clarus]|uniref:Kinase-like domain-containing protein n=1 Tax=Rhizophagus clarus TaxID=94130 RepID=A0A2Z6SB39_9GLOM|nr:hypothetical protein RclHR1_00680026 [Rhizophagus clarus]GES91004.1 kinase-like domain-containing protein [Rhizophagus clarus]
MFNKQINSNDIITSNTNNLLHENIKIDIKEIEPTTKNINENIFEEELSIVIDEIVDIILQGLNEGKDEKPIKQEVLKFINDHKIDLTELYNWLLNNQNNSNSIYMFGYLNYYGIGTDINKQKTIKLYQKAAKLENITAQLNLANMYIHGNGVDINHNKAFKLSEKLAKKGIPNAINKLGHCYHKGVGTKVDFQKAFELFQKATDLGNSNGMINLGYCYHNGIGTEIDEQKTFELFQKAANLGNDIAQYNLATMYEIGNGVKKDINLAIYWYKKSAEQGYKDAQYELKRLLEN